MHAIKNLNFSYRVEIQNGKRMIFCQVRKRWVSHTPEEETRQTFLHFLNNVKGYSYANIKLEHRMNSEDGKIFKADIVVSNKMGNPFIVVECKKDTLNINQELFEQVKKYNQVLKSQWICVTNGLYYDFRYYDVDLKEYQVCSTLPDKDWLNFTKDRFLMDKQKLLNEIRQIEKQYIDVNCPYKIGDKFNSFIIKNIIVDDKGNFVYEYENGKN